MPDLIHPRTRLSADSRAMIAGEPHCFALRDQEKVFFRNETTQNVITLTDAEIFERHSLGEMWEIMDPPAGSSTPLRDGLEKVHFLGLTENKKEKITRDLSYAKALLSAPRGHRSGENARKIIADTAKSLGDSKRPLLRKVQGDVKLLRRSGGNAEFLLSKYRAKRKRRSRTPDLERELMNECLRKHYLIAGEPSLQSAYEAFLDELGKLWQNQPYLARSTPPSYTTFKRVLERSYDIYEIYAYRYGEKEAERWLRTKQQGVPVERPLEIVLTDATPFQVFVVDEKGNVQERLTLTLMLDLYSRMILGFHLGYESESWSGYSQALRNAMSPKDYLSRLYPDIAGKWPNFGRFETAIGDATSAMVNGHLQDACAFLGMNWETTRTANPESKGAVERAFRTIFEQLTDLLPGGSRFNKEQWKLRNPVEEACMTLEEAREIFTRWIVTVYHHTPHRGLKGRTPLQAWQEGIAKIDVRPPPSEVELSICLTHSRSAVLQHDGVHFQGMTYRAPELSYLLKPGKRVEVRFFYDDQNIDKIFVRDVERSCIIVAEADDQEYARNLSVAQNQRIRKELREKYKKSAPTAMELARAKREIIGKFDARIQRPGKITRGLRDMVAQGNRMPYGNNPDGRLKLSSPGGFDDLSAQPADNSAPAIPSEANIGSVSPRVGSVSTEGDTGPVSNEDASVPSPSTGDKEQSSADTPATNPETNGEDDDIDRMLGEKGWDPKPKQ